MQIDFNRGNNMSRNFHDNTVVLGCELGFPTSVSFLAKSSVCHAQVLPLGEKKNLGVGGN